MAEPLPGRRKDLAARIKPAEADGADPIRALAPFLAVRPELDSICRFGTRWRSVHAAGEPSGWAPFHIVTRGACVIDLGAGESLTLREGDAAILPHDGPHVVRAVGPSPAPEHPPAIRRRPHDDILVREAAGFDAAGTELLCGRLKFEEAQGNLVLMALPPALTLSAADGPDAARLKGFVETMRAVLDEERMGGAAIAAALAGAVMMLALRNHLEAAPQGEGILALLARRQTARTLAAMLAEPERDWSLDALADLAATSRATLVRLFRTSVGEAPLAFLTELRLTLARRRLQASATALAVIAEGVGYQSETAFSRAYHRRFGVAPGADRRGFGGTQ